MTQVALAQAARIDENTVVNWEKYETMPLRAKSKVKRVCEALGLDFDQLAQKFPWKELLK